MPCSPTTQKLDAGQRFVLRKGKLSVESKKKYGQRSCFSKIVHGKEYDSEKILNALQSFYSKSLTKNEVKVLKKNIRITIQQAAKENVKAAQMGSFTRWLFNKHVVELKPYTQTFETLQSTTFHPKLIELKKKYDKIDKDPMLQKSKYISTHFLLEFQRINASIQEDLASIKAMKQPHRPAQDITQLDNAEGKYNSLWPRLKKKTPRVDELFIADTDLILEEVATNPDAQTIKEYLKSLNVNRDYIKKLDSSIQASLKSLHYTEKAIKKCQKTLEALQNRPDYQQEIKEILDKVTLFPSQNKFDKDYGRKANTCIDEAKLALEKIQKTLITSSPTYKQILEELASLEKSRQPLEHVPTLYYGFASFKKYLKAHRSDALNDYLDKSLLFSFMDKTLTDVKKATTTPYDFFSYSIDEYQKKYDIKYNAYLKSFDFDQYVAETVTKKQLELIAELKSKYPVNADFTKNTQAIQEIAQSVSKAFYLTAYLSQVYNHHYCDMIIDVLHEKKIATCQKLFKPFFQAFRNSHRDMGDDLQTLVSNWNALKIAKNQYKYLKVWDPKRVHKKFLKEDLQVIEEKISHIFSERVQEINALSDKFKEKFLFSVDSKEQAELYMEERKQTFEKMLAIATQHKHVPSIPNAQVSSHEQLMKAAIAKFSNDTKDTAAFIKSNLLAYQTIEEHLKTCLELKASADELANLDKVTNLQECLASRLQLNADKETIKALKQGSVVQPKIPFAIDALHDLAEQLKSLDVLHKKIQEDLDKRMHDFNK